MEHNTQPGKLKIFRISYKIANLLQWIKGTQNLSKNAIVLRGSDYALFTITKSVVHHSLSVLRGKDDRVFVSLSLTFNWQNVCIKQKSNTSEIENETRPAFRHKIMKKSPTRVR